MSINFFIYLNDGLSYSKRGKKGEIMINTKLIQKLNKIPLNWYPNLDPLVLKHF